MNAVLEEILTRVQKPARYTGGEYNEVIKDKAEVDIRMAFCFPDTYEIGMSNLGLHILYGAINAQPGMWCERCFAPWGDMEEELRRARIPLYALESGDPLTEFDAIGFSLGYEMFYTSVLNMLELAGIPVRSADRKALTPLVFAGGTACVNPEPMADFLDLCAIGEGEELDVEILKLLRKAKSEDWDKPRFLREAANIPGVYVPGLYRPEYNEDGTLKSVTPLDGAPEKVTKRIIEDLDTAFYPTKTIVPSTEIVHDRVVLELFRGCVRGCRFCQAGFAYRPVRRHSTEFLLEKAKAALMDSGYEEITLSSLSTSDFKGLAELTDGLLEWCEPRKISLSLPSLRADNFSMGLMERVQKVRKSGLTFAPEAGSQRLRDVINKNVTEEALLNSCRIAFEGGWNTLKLYFMLGLPTETDEDVVAIARLAEKVLHTWREYASNKSRGVKITVSTSMFVPKPQTPFEWEAQVSIEEYLRRVKLLRESINSRAIVYNWHEPHVSLIEAALSRGDRRVGAVIEEVWRNGGKLDSWTDYFSMERWLDAFKTCGLDPEFYALRIRGDTELFPWDVINVGVSKGYLARERREAYAERVTPDCRVKCMGCGANCLLERRACDE